MLNGFYKGKKVLVTGNTGFKGAWLSVWLLELGAHVTGYALDAPTEPSLFGTLGLAGKITSVKGDVRDLEALKTVFRERKPEIVIHMAAQALVRQSYDDPLYTYATNVIGTANVLEVCRAASSVRAIVNVTSDKCYENTGKGEGYRENDPLGGYDPYSSSKGCSELVTGAYLRSFFNPEHYMGRHKVALASARSGNVIGGGDWSEDRLIPDGVRAFSARKTLVVRYPDAVRPWQFVLEPLYGYLLLAKKLYEEGPSFSGAWNFGPSAGDAKPVRWIVEHMADMWGADARSQLDHKEKPHEEKVLTLDSSKARMKLGWEPCLALNEALEKTIGWYKAYYDGEDMFKRTIAVIKDFERTVDEKMKVRRDK